MTFDAGIPQASDFISASQSQIQTNFSQSNTAFGVDHTAFDEVSDQGFHKKTTFIQQTVNPDPVGPLSNLYTKAAPTTANTADLYYQNGALAADVSQVTGGGITAACWCHFSAAAPGTFNPSPSYNINQTSKIVVTFVSFSSNNCVVNFARNFTNTDYCAIITGYGTGAILANTVIRSVSSLSFNINPAATDVNVVIFGTLT